MTTHTHLRQQLQRLDGQSYGAYKDLERRYQFPEFTLLIDRVQGDPFAAPSQMRVRVPQAIAQLPPEWSSTPSRAIALRDYLTRQAARIAKGLQQSRGSGRSGMLSVSVPGQPILERTSVLLDAAAVELRFVVGLPAFGRRIAGQQAIAMLCEDLPDWVARSLRLSALDATAVQRHLDTAEDADWLRSQLAPHNLVAFIADGSILPRRSGVDDRPLPDGIPLQSPESLRVEFTCPHRGRISGMGIPAGVTVIVGGGYHGKSTLLHAIERGVYTHIPGDGREFVVTNPTAVKVRAEDGRSVAQVNISPFINRLPLGRSPTNFSTENASGSTSQAATIIEALEAGSQVLLVDEDTSATNFMIRDRRMQALISKDQEPITPFIDKIRQLYTEQGVSTILVMGGSGDYFDVADTVIALQEFEPRDVTAAAQAIAQEYATHRRPEGGQTFGTLTPRYLPAVPMGDRGKWKTDDLDTISLDREEIDVSAVEQLVDPAQLRAIAASLLYLQTHYLDGSRTVPQLLDAVLSDLQTQGFDVLNAIPSGDLAMFRRFELAAALNRWRSLLGTAASPSRQRRREAAEPESVQSGERGDRRERSARDRTTPPPATRRPPLQKPPRQRP